MNKLSLKTGVVFSDMSYHIIFAIPVVMKVFSHFGVPIVITSGRDGKHKTGSKHYVGDAIDFRTWAFDVNEKESACQMLRYELGQNYDVVLESDHIHLEFDPK